MTATRILLVIGLATLAPAPARAEGIDAKEEAQKVLDAGAALFDTRDARAMAQTYTEDAVFTLLAKDGNTGDFQAQETRGRSEIEAFYRKLYDDHKDEARTTSKNTVEFARRFGDELMVIHGVFQPNTQSEDKVPFVQVRVKKAGKWLMKSLQLFLAPKE